MDWEFSKSVKKCLACQNAFKGDDIYFSALFVQPAPGATKTKQAGSGAAEPTKELFVRKDYCLACWEQKTEAPFSFWQSRLASKNKPKTPREILLNFFDNLINPPAGPATEDLTGEQNQPGRQTVTPELRPKVVYLFSLILLRKKILKLKESKNKDGQEFLIMQKTGSQPAGSEATTGIQTYEIPDLKISEEELVALRNEFARLFEFEL